MEFIASLIIIPLIVAALLLVIRAEAARTVVVYVGAGVIGVVTLVFCGAYLGTGGVYFDFSSAAVDILATLVGVAVAITVIAYAVKHRNMLALALACVQLAGTFVFEFVFAGNIEVQQGIYVDSLSLLMCAIIGIVGSGICVYAVGYMRDFQSQHADQRDRRPMFFALMFLFLSAMFVIVLCDNMHWMFVGWEVTTLCSFLLIGFTKTEEATNNAFRQIIMNMAGGIAFLAALMYCAYVGTLSLSQFVYLGVTSPDLAVFPLTCLAFAGITKAAQMPFHTWLLGAMVAPTPTSALLHSSTMVKAGVFLLVKIAPALAVSLVPSIMVTLVGGLTFCLCSFMAISQTNAKRVLAYSTIANLGLIVACAGVGTAEAIWAACFLILFHAVAKSLLFLCVGTAEHHIGSRDIESMDGLFERMPRLARFMMLGIMGMFVAPFGMLISKWAVLVTFADSRQVVLLILLVFGSAATFMFWAKWLGKLSGIAGRRDNVEESVYKSEWFAIGLMAALVGLCCVTLPLISDAVVLPYIVGLGGFVSAQMLSSGTLWLCSVLAVIVFAVVIWGLHRSGTARETRPYLAGVSSDDQTSTSFRGSMGDVRPATLRNMYLESVFGEAKLDMPSTVVTALILVAAFAYACADLFVLF